MTVFCIGGTGFIGQVVTHRLLDAGHAVSIFHRGRTTTDLPDAATIHHGDRDHPAALRDALDVAAPDVVLDVIPYTEAHADTLTRLCDGRTDHIVAISSGDVYRQYDGLRGESDRAPDPVPLSENAPLRSTRYPYRGTDTDFAYAYEYEKILVEKRICNGPVPATPLRLPKVYGPGDGEHHVGTALSRLREADTSLVLGSDEAHWRWSRGYVTNVAAAIVAAVTDPVATGRTYNVGEPDALPQTTWLQRLTEVAGLSTSIRIVNEDRSGPSPFNWNYSMALDTRKIRTELGFAEPISSQQALVRSILWERDSASTASA